MSDGDARAVVDDAPPLPVEAIEVIRRVFTTSDLK